MRASGGTKPQSFPPRKPEAKRPRLTVKGDESCLRIESLSVRTGGRRAASAGLLAMSCFAGVAGLARPTPGGPRPSTQRTPGTPPSSHAAACGAHAGLLGVRKQISRNPPLVSGSCTGSRPRRVPCAAHGEAAEHVVPVPRHCASANNVPGCLEPAEEAAPGQGPLAWPATSAHLPALDPSTVSGRFRGAPWSAGFPSLSFLCDRATSRLLGNLTGSRFLYVHIYTRRICQQLTFSVPHPNSFWC